MIPCSLIGCTLPHESSCSDNISPPFPDIPALEQMLKFQSENTYRGKKGNRCWCLPESVLKKLIAPFYPKDSDRAAIVAKGGRQELCNLLMHSVAGSFGKYGVTASIATPSDHREDIDVQMADGKLMKKENLQNIQIPPRSLSLSLCGPYIWSSVWFEDGLLF